MAGPDDRGSGPPEPFQPVAWRAGDGAAAVAGASWPVGGDAAALQGLDSLAPLWAGVLAHWASLPLAQGPARLVVVEGRALTLIDCVDGVPRQWVTAAVDLGDDVVLANVRSPSADAVWVAGHSGPSSLPQGLQPVPGLGLPSQGAPALLQALQQGLPDIGRVEPAFRRAPPLSPRVGAALLGTSLLVLLLASAGSWDAWQAWQGAQVRAEARQRLAATQARQRQGGDAAQQAALQRLQQPWAERWAAAEAAQPAGGGWLRLEQRRDVPRLLLAGEADSPAEALAVARRISLQPAVAEASVLRSESQAATARARFEVGVRLKGLSP